MARKTGKPKGVKVYPNNPEPPGGVEVQLTGEKGTVEPIKPNRGGDVGTNERKSYLSKKRFLGHRNHQDKRKKREQSQEQSCQREGDPLVLLVEPRGTQQ